MSKRGYAAGRRSNRYWTEERVRTLTQLWNKGVDAGVIGARLNPPRSAGAVMAQAYRIGLEKRRYLHGSGKASVLVTMSKDEKNAIAMRAMIRGMNLSAYIRMLVKYDTIREPV